MSTYRFGPFEVRTHTEELYKFGTKLSLRGQPFQILQALLKRPGEVVTRDEVRDQLWPSDTFVDFEHGINASLRKLRVALGDSALKPLYIETLPGVGYRFIAPLDTAEETQATAAPPTLEQPGTGAANGEYHEKTPFDVGSDSGWRKGLVYGLAIGVVACGLLFLATKWNWNRPVVHSVPATAPDVPPASSPVASEPEISARNSRTATSNLNSLSLRGWPAQASSPIHGKVWVVSVAAASQVAFPPPSTTPDATFITRGIAYIGSAPKICYTLVTFLTECGIGGFDLKFSGRANANLGGAAAGPETAMSGHTWGILIEFDGTTELRAGQEIAILHDDGVALEIDGKHIPGFVGGPTTPTMEFTTFTGSNGIHSFDLLYANAAGGGAWLLFYPALY